MKHFYLTWIILSLISNGFSQTTGSFSDKVSFNGQDRIISGYVPTNYDTTTTYQLMICLHGSGDNSNNYRNALINSLNWKSVFNKTIFICPDGGDDYYSDFSNPPGDEEIIQKTLDYAFKKFKIDSNNIILQGFSLGGRSALKYGLDNPEKFKGLLLNTPAIQGLADALNKIPASGEYYNYKNSSKVPVFITCGENDILYMTTIPPMLEQLILNNCKVKFISFPGVDHTIPNKPSVINSCLTFFEEPSSAQYDLEIFKIEMEDRFCNEFPEAKVYIRNLGKSIINSFDLNYKITGSDDTFKWTGNLGSFEHAVITLPDLNPSVGADSLIVNIGLLNNSISDTFVTNNRSAKLFEIITNGVSLPVTEGFENNSDGWIFPVTGSLFYWYTDNEVYNEGKASLSNFNTILIFYTLGDIESFLSPIVDLTSIANPKISFDYAFNYHKYTPPYFTQDVVFADTLDVSISLDCGMNFQTLYKKGGAELATVLTPIVNPLSIEACFFTPKKNEWKTLDIQLDQFSNAKEAIIKFSYISGLGGNIYIDNIKFNEKSSALHTVSNQDLLVYPNPATNKIFIDNSQNNFVKMQLFDITGRCVLDSDMEQGINEKNVGSLNNGIYLIRLEGKNMNIQKKLVINR